MDKRPPSEVAIQRAAESLREEAVNRLNADMPRPTNGTNRNGIKSHVSRRSTKRNDALVNCMVLTAVIGLSTLVHPLDWRLAVGCLCAGMVMALAAFLEKKGRVGFSVVVLLAAIGLELLSMALFGAKGPMIWIQGMPLMGLGSFGVIYVLFDKFELKE